ncbi:MAG TPA: SDR family NAD(P)-dependent oxidoreductase [Solirubrobacteraceae bacterium]|jgi:short-subunit dehydrogenase|nr:SDR family NAD(P)-dependent oxidoreductase [Solirubrobacteraceae bacterium]
MSETSPNGHVDSQRPYVVLVTGASSGIGEACARRLARLPNAALLLIARREERLLALCKSLGTRASHLAIDLTDEDAPARIAERVHERYGRLDLLVNNAGAAWRATFADGGYANVRRTMQIDFDAQLRLTEALLPLLHESSPSAIVNVASTAGRVARAGSGAYSAAKFALAGWSDSLYHEERPYGVHVGLVLPGFISTEGFPQAELTERALTRWIVSTPETAAEAIYETGVLRKPERYVPRAYWIAAALRILAPRLVRRALGGGAAAVITTTTGADLAERQSEA